MREPLVYGRNPRCTSSLRLDSCVLKRDPAKKVNTCQLRQRVPSAPQLNASTMWSRGPGPIMYEMDAADLWSIRMPLNTSDQINTESAHWHHHHRSCSAAAGDTESESHRAIAHSGERPDPSRSQLSTTGAEADTFTDKLTVSQLLLQNSYRFSKFLESSDTDEGEATAVGLARHPVFGSMSAACHGHAAARPGAAAAAVASPASALMPSASAHTRSHSTVDPRKQKRLLQPPPPPPPPLPPPPTLPADVKSARFARTRYFFVSTFLKNLRANPAREEFVEVLAESFAPSVEPGAETASQAVVQQPQCLVFWCAEPVRCLQSLTFTQSLLSCKSEETPPLFAASDHQQPPPSPPPSTLPSTLPLTSQSLIPMPQGRRGMCGGRRAERNHHRRHYHHHRFGAGRRESNGSHGSGRTASVLRSMSRHLHGFFCPGSISCGRFADSVDRLVIAQLVYAETPMTWVSVDDLPSIRRCRPVTARFLAEPASSTSGCRATARVRCADAPLTHRAEWVRHCGVGGGGSSGGGGGQGDRRPQPHGKSQDISPDRNNSMRLSSHSGSSRRQHAVASALDTLSSTAPSFESGPRKEASTVAEASETKKNHTGSFASLLRTLDRARQRLEEPKPAATTVSHRKVVPRCRQQPQRERARRQEPPSCSHSRTAMGTRSRRYHQICEAACEIKSDRQEEGDGDRDANWRGGGNQSNAPARDMQWDLEVCEDAECPGAADAADPRVSVELVTVQLTSGDVARWREPPRSPREFGQIKCVTECLLTLSHNLQSSVDRIRGIHSLVSDLEKCAVTWD